MIKQATPASAVIALVLFACTETATHGGLASDAESADVGADSASAVTSSPGPAGTLGGGALGSGGFGGAGAGLSGAPTIAEASAQAAVMGSDNPGVPQATSSSVPTEMGGSSSGGSTNAPTTGNTDAPAPPGPGAGAGGDGGANGGEGGVQNGSAGAAAGSAGATATGGGGGATGGVGPFDDGPRNPDATTLRDKYEGYFAIGAAVDSQSYNSHAAILTQHFNSVTSENDMKFESLQPSEGNFTFATADGMVDWALQNGMQVRGHALVWHRQTPSWVFSGASRDQLLARMETHISAVMEHFRGRVQVWDVVNEAVLPDGTLRTGEAEEEIDRSQWYAILGEDYIAAAFRFAREADPDVKLFYNDYHNYIPVKRQATVEMLERALDQGAPIDGVGMQCHINIEPSTVETHQSYHQTVENMEEAIKAYSALGLEVQITEMDVSLYTGGVTYEPADFFTPATFTPDLQERQAERYREFFELFRRYRDAITSVTFWGVADDNTWLSEFSSGRQDFPLLFDINHDPKPAFERVMDF